jgi:tol-pal system protein YbgF
MPKPGFSWLIIGLLGSLALSSAVRAQAPDSTLTLELLQRIEQLELEVRYIRGELELYRHQVEGLQQERAATASAERPAVSDSPAPVPPPSTEVSAPDAERTPPVPPPTIATGAEQADFDAALDELRDGHYAQAIADFQGFLNAYPDSRLAGDAQYRLGESYYVSRDYEAAKEAFINLGLRYPQSARLPDALLKLGYIYGELGDAARARDVLQKLMQVYPDSQAADLAEQQLQSLH